MFFKSNNENFNLFNQDFVYQSVIVNFLLLNDYKIENFKNGIYKIIKNNNEKYILIRYSQKTDKNKKFTFSKPEDSTINTLNELLNNNNEVFIIRLFIKMEDGYYKNSFFSIDEYNNNFSWDFTIGNEENLEFNGLDNFFKFLEEKKEKNNKKNYFLVYLDLLGFSNFINENTEGALGLIENYFIQISINKDKSLNKIFDIEDNISSFDYFLPFSDSIFIASKNDPDLFIEQISKFLIDCFEYAVKLNNNENPMIYQIEEQVDYVNRKIIFKPKDVYIYPTLFRCGGTYDEVIIINNNVSIQNKNKNSIVNLSGKGVVKSVSIEKNSGKGPKFLIDENFYNKLNENTKKFILKYQDGLYEVLWPLYDYDFKNDCKNEIINKFLSNFDYALRLYIYYIKDIKISEHYLYLTEILVKSALQYGKIKNDLENVKICLKNYINNNFNIGNIFFTFIDKFY